MKQVEGKISVLHHVRREERKPTRRRWPITTAVMVPCATRTEINALDCVDLRLTGCLFRRGVALLSGFHVGSRRKHPKWPLHCREACPRPTASRWTSKEASLQKEMFPPEESRFPPWVMLGSMFVAGSEQRHCFASTKRVTQGKMARGM